MATKKQLAAAKKLLTETKARQKDLDTKLAQVNKNVVPSGGFDVGRFRLAEAKADKPKSDVNPNPKSDKDVTPTPDKDTPLKPDITLVDTIVDEYGNTVGIYSDGSKKILVPSGRQYKSTVDLDAYALLEETFKAYGLETLVPKIKTYMERGLGSNQAALQLKTEPEYVERFRGNELRRSAGLNVLSEGEYLALEDAYSRTLRAYGLQNYFGTDRKVRTMAMADIIGNDIDATEFRDRIDTVVTRVQNADPTIKSTLKSFYNIGDADLIKYFLNPKENLPKLQEKVTSAEIGSEFIKQGLVTGVLSAEEFAKLGIDKAAAAKGAETIATILPEGTKLGKIYAEEGIDYTQRTAEEEVFKGLASAERKRRQLIGRESASFSGTSGVSKSAFGSATGGAF